MEISDSYLTQLLLLPLYQPARILFESSNQKYALQYLTQFYARRNQKFQVLTASNVRESLSAQNEERLAIFSRLDQFPYESTSLLNQLVFGIPSFIAVSTLKLKQQFLMCFDVVVYVAKVLIPHPVSIYSKSNLRPNLQYQKAALASCYLDCKLKTAIQQQFLLLRKLYFKLDGRLVAGFQLGGLSTAETICRVLALARGYSFCLPSDANLSVLITCLRNLNTREMDNMELEEVIRQVREALDTVAVW